MDNKHGSVTKLTMKVVGPLSFFLSGSKVKQQFYHIPLTQALKAALVAVGKHEMHLTGVTVEFDIYHSVPVEVDMNVVLKPAGFVGGRVDTDMEKGQMTAYVGGFDDGFPESSVALLEEGNLMVMDLVHGRYREQARDGTIFQAPLSSSVVNPAKTIDYTMKYSDKESIKRVARSSRVAFKLTKVSPEGVHLKATVRMYISLDRVVSQETEEIGLLGGVRAAASAVGRPTKGELPCGKLDAMRVVYHTRVK
jgi:hypothetical protein